MSPETQALLTHAFDQRRDWLQPPHDKAFRLFNGFAEGLPTLALDVYGSTLVVHDHSPDATGDRALVDDAVRLARKVAPFVSVVLWKVRHAKAPAARAGTVIVGEPKGLGRRVKEDGVTYKLDLTLNRDTSLYLDTRALRRWAKAECRGAQVLNTFAYTGSLGLAAHAGGATRVVHTDLDADFLQLAKDGTAMNGWPIRKTDFRPGDFFDVVGKLKREDQLFDVVFVDPPYFSRTEQGVVNVAEELARLVNKVRPLVAHDGRLVLVNNAVFVSGQAFLATLEGLCADGFLRVEQRLDVDPDFAGYPSTRKPNWPQDPAPFNHSTKVVVLRATRKNGRTTAGKA